MAVMDKNNFINYIWKELDQRGWKQSDLARRAGIKDGTLSNILGGHRKPSVETLHSLARALGEPPDKLLRIAGYLPAALPNSSQLEEDLLHSFRALPKEQQVFITNLIRGTRSSAPPPRPETEPEEIMDVLMLLEDHHRREVFRFIRWLYREQQNPTDADGVSYRIREAAHQLSVVELMAAFNKLPPDQQREIIKTLGDFSAADSDQ